MSDDGLSRSLEGVHQRSRGVEDLGALVFIALRQVGLAMQGEPLQQGGHLLRSVWGNGDVTIDKGLDRLIDLSRMAIGGAVGVVCCDSHCDRSLGGTWMEKGLGG